MVETVQCKPCQGTGKAYGYGLGVCTACDGRGSRPRDRQRTDPCAWCGATGLNPATGSDRCSLCDGFGLRYPPDWEANEDGPLVWFVQAGKPRTAHLLLKDVFTKLSGHIRICDPYYGKGSLLRLDLLTHCGPIQFLTREPGGGETTTLPQEIREYQKQYSVRFRLLQGKDLHDRYLLTSDELILLGHGLKDIGGRESFLVRLSESMCSDLIEQVRQSFDDKWSNAEPLL